MVRFDGERIETVILRGTYGGWRGSIEEERGRSRKEERKKKKKKTRKTRGTKNWEEEEKRWSGRKEEGEEKACYYGYY